MLVHRGGVVDNKFVDATKSFGANIKQYRIGDKIELGNDDWANIKSAFKALVETTTKRYLK